MKKRLLDLSGKIDNLRVGVFESVSTVAGISGFPFCVVGASARDMILLEGYGIDTGRVTMDIDLGVQVQDWPGYDKIKIELIKTGRFKADKKRSQRLLFEDLMPIDIIPFGAIAGPDQLLSWPPEHDTSISTVGFEDVCYNSIIVRICANPVLDIPFASLAGLTLLKIISWDDNPLRRDKDAHDLLLLMRTYLDAGNQERLWEEENDLMGDDFDYVLAGSRLLGRDIARMLSPYTKGMVVKILDKETGEQNRYRLVENMMYKGAEGRDFDMALRLLEELKTGILE